MSRVYFSKTMLFDTNRLFVRHLEEDDQEWFYDMQSNPKVMLYIKAVMNRKESKTELDRFIGYYKDTTVFFKIWAVVEKCSNKFIGICGVYKNDINEFEIAYRVRECFWGKGFGKEIAKGLIKYCFSEMHLEQLTGYVSKQNISSVRILEKEMIFVEEFYSVKENSIERKYTLKNFYKKR